MAYQEPAANNMAANLIRKALGYSATIEVYYEDDHDLAYSGIEWETIWSEVTACDSATVVVEFADSKRETLRIINDGCVDAVETAADMTADGVLSAWWDELDAIHGDS